MDGKIIRDKLVGNEEERGVSPVIGVILMVAITVILAAVIAAFVLDLGDMSESANAGIEFDESGEYVTPQVIDEGNTDSIYVEVVNGSGGADYIAVNGDTSDTTEDWEVGDSVQINSDGLGEDEGEISNLGSHELQSSDTVDEIIVYGEVEGEQQVITTWD
ncbi:type IV pilin [Natronobacterium haloterrestre]|uniref:type IV pilin n=1 Tax=Natronobacterium haloterrestre TaxID=148448 RepID=UPI000B7CED98|nr:type IV pilin N-terminal domain-containing protein [Halobiforma haloterrestris]